MHAIERTRHNALRTRMRQQLHHSHPLCVCVCVCVPEQASPLQSYHDAACGRVWGPHCTSNPVSSGMWVTGMHVWGMFIMAYHKLNMPKRLRWLQAHKLNIGSHTFLRVPSYAGLNANVSSYGWNANTGTLLWLHMCCQYILTHTCVGLVWAWSCVCLCQAHRVCTCVVCSQIAREQTPRVCSVLFIVLSVVSKVLLGLKYDNQ